MCYEFMVKTVSLYSDHQKGLEPFASSQWSLKVDEDQTKTEHTKNQIVIIWLYHTYLVFIYFGINH